MDGRYEGAAQEAPPPAPVPTWIIMASTPDGVVVYRTGFPDAPTPWGVLCVCPADAMVEASLRTGLCGYRRPNGAYRDAPAVRAVADALRIVSATDDHARGVRDARWVAGWVERNWGAGRNVSVVA